MGYRDLNKDLIALWTDITSIPRQFRQGEHPWGKVFLVIAAVTIISATTLIALRNYWVRFFTKTVSNISAVENHPVLGTWSGEAFAHSFTFHSDGTLTGSVYQWPVRGNWTASSNHQIRFSIEPDAHSENWHLIFQQSPYTGILRALEMDVTSATGQSWRSFLRRSS